MVAKIYFCWECPFFKIYSPGKKTPAFLSIHSAAEILQQTTSYWGLTSCLSTIKNKIETIIVVLHQYQPAS